ncbi:MAG: hypothetical protein MZV70_58945 [Desulfobacterales bacterium]|nr:hypothetical protein [Desulfobacterales bacterium]
MEFRNINLVALCRKITASAAERNDDRIRIAQLTLNPESDGSIAYAVCLETWMHGDRMRACRSSMDVP